MAVDWLVKAALFIPAFMAVTALCVCFQRRRASRHGEWRYLTPGPYVWLALFAGLLITGVATLVVWGEPGQAGSPVKIFRKQSSKLLLLSHDYGCTHFYRVCVVSRSGSAPGFLQDVFVRVGGPDGSASDPVAAKNMVEIHADHVVGDNMWFWRADHTRSGGTTPADNPVGTGLVVTGDDVIMQVRKDLMPTQ